MDNIKKLRFFYGNKKEYESFISNNESKEIEEEKKGYFYIVIEKNYVELYFGNKLLASSDINNTIEDKVNTAIQEEMNNYIQKATTENTTIAADLSITKNLSVGENFSAKGSFSAGNLQYSTIKNEEGEIIKETFQTNASIISENDLQCKKLTSNNLDVSNVVTTNSDEKSVVFSKDVNIVLPETLDKHDSNNNLIWSFNTETGELIVDNITVSGSLSYTNVNMGASPSFTSIQIGNIKLEDDGKGNLKITSINTKE